LILIATGVQVLFVRFLPVDIPFVNEIVTVVWVVGITNALNFLDNMDGLSSGVAAVAAGFFLLLAAFSGQYLVASLAAALLGACIGFLYYNFNPATIFMGDSGSLFIGFVLAAVGIKLRFDNPDIVTWMVPVLVLGLPVFDTTLVVVSRIRRGVNPFTTAGKDHTSHRLVAMGFTRREAVLILYMSCVVLGMIALFLTRASVLEAYATAGVVAVLALIALVRLELVQPAEASSSPPAKVDALVEQQ
jgi:UDP-GlcNAc:undecaprenyl-phosphate GlcNAc-1-phosphate transferase